MAAEAIKEGACDYLLNDADYKDSLYKNTRQVSEHVCISTGRERITWKQQSVLFRQIYRSQKWWQNHY